MKFGKNNEAICKNEQGSQVATSVTNSGASLPLGAETELEETSHRLVASQVGLFQNGSSTFDFAPPFLIGLPHGDLMLRQRSVVPVRVVIQISLGQLEEPTEIAILSKINERHLQLLLGVPAKMLPGYLVETFLNGAQSTTVITAVVVGQAARSCEGIYGQSCSSQKPTETLISNYRSI